MLVDISKMKSSDPVSMRASTNAQTHISLLCFTHLIEEQHMGPAQPVKVAVTKPEELSSVSLSHIVVGEN